MPLVAPARFRIHWYETSKKLLLANFQSPACPQSRNNVSREYRHYSYFISYISKQLTSPSRRFYNLFSRQKGLKVRNASWRTCSLPAAAPTEVYLINFCQQDRGQFLFKLRCWKKITALECSGTSTRPLKSSLSKLPGNPYFKCCLVR